MSTFHLKISTPDGLLFDGEVERVRARTDSRHIIGMMRQ